MELLDELYGRDTNLVPSLTKSILECREIRSLRIKGRRATAVVSSLSLETIDSGKDVHKGAPVSVVFEGYELVYGRFVKDCRKEPQTLDRKGFPLWYKKVR